MKVILIIDNVQSEIINNLNNQTIKNPLIYVVLNKFSSKDEINILKNKIRFKSEIITNITHNFYPWKNWFVKNQILKNIDNDLIIFLDDTFEVDSDFLEKINNKRFEIYNNIKIDFILCPIINYKKWPFIKSIGKKINAFFIKNVKKENKKIITNLLPWDNVLIWNSKIFKKYLFDNNISNYDYLEFSIRIFKEVPIFITKDIKIYKMKIEEDILEKLLLSIKTRKIIFI